MEITKQYLEETRELVFSLLEMAAEIRQFPRRGSCFLMCASRQQRK